MTPILLLLSIACSWFEPPPPVTVEARWEGRPTGLGHAFAHRRKFLGAEADLDLVDFYVMRVEC